MRIWMADTKDEETGDRECSIIFAEHQTGAYEKAEKHAGKGNVEDVFEILLDDPRWDTLHLVGLLKSPERF